MAASPSPLMSLWVKPCGQPRGTPVVAADGHTNGPSDGEAYVVVPALGGAQLVPRGKTGEGGDLGGRRGQGHRKLRPPAGRPSTWPRRGWLGRCAGVRSSAHCGGKARRPQLQHQAKRLWP